MNYVIRLYVRDVKDTNRTIIVNGDLPLQLFIKSLILSMNGNTNDLYLLQKNNRPLEFNDTANLSSLNLRVDDIYQIVYNYDDKPWILGFAVLEKNEGLNEKKMEIIQGSGYGICQSEDMLFIKDLINSKNDKWKKSVLEHYKTLNNYFNSTFLLEENNKLVNDYIASYEDMHTPKSIIMNVSLNGFDKVIKRKIIVNNNISIDKFCRAIIASMRGDMSHLYTIKMNKKWYDEDILNQKLNYFELSVGKRLKIIYDFGDNWEFNVRVSKVIDGYHDKEFEILNGAGYGIIEDCGGSYSLYRAFNGTNDYFGTRDINEFNLNKLQKQVEENLKVDNFHQERIEYY